jgi:hypothetical protein
MKLTNVLLNLLLLLLGVLIGYAIKPIITKIKNYYFTRYCIESFSRCLDCDFKNDCKRYSNHLKGKE